MNSENTRDAAHSDAGSHVEKVHTPERHDNEWAWRRRIRQKPNVNRAYRIGVGVLGVAVIIIGIILLPFPGPGWLIIFAGLGILASEFDRAQDLLAWVKRRVEAWWDMLDRKGWWAKALAGLGTFILVVLIFWAMFAVSGVPSWFPDIVEDQLKKVPGLG